MLRVIVAVLLLACIALPTSAAPCAGFTDVEDTDPFCPNVTWIKNRNITLGCAVGLYCPASAVSRLSMAAFLSRLGDVVLPPNVIWVAPTGGMFQSIQAAIDYAATLPPQPRRLVKIAPGTYSEAITMATGVDVEGSGPEATVIDAAVCGSGAPTTGTVTGASESQLRDITVRMSGSAGGNQCAAVYLDNVKGNALRNVRIEMSLVGNAPTFGVIVRSSGIQPVSLTLDQVYINAFDLGPTRTGIVIDVTAFSSVQLQDVTFVALADAALAVGISISSGTLTLDRTKVLVAPGIPGPGAPTPLALQASGTSTVIAERSWLRAQGGTFADVAGGATLRIANSMIDGSLTGAAVCFSLYGPNFTAATC